MNLSITVKSKEDVNILALDKDISPKRDTPG